MASSKIISSDSIAAFSSNLKNLNEIIVFTNGCFDLLHPGHLDYLEKAKKLGTVLIVGVNSDESIKRIKGKNRPINDLNFRMEMLAGLSHVDYVVPFSEDTPENLIKKITPQFLVKGGDYKMDQIVGADWVIQHKGEVKILSFLQGFSSSSIISKIQSLT